MYSEHVWFRVQGLGFRVQGSGFRVQGSGFRVQNLGLRVAGLGVWGYQGGGGLEHELVVLDVEAVGAPRGRRDERHVVVGAPRELDVQQERVGGCLLDAPGLV